MPHVMTRPGLLRPAQLAVLLALVHAVNDALTAVLGALLPALRDRLDLESTTLALLVTVFAISSSATQPTIGAMADRFGLRKFAAAGVATAAVALSLVGPASSVAVLLILLTVGGLGSAALHPISTSIVGGPASRNPGLAVGTFTAGGMIGYAVGPVIILALVAAYGPSSTAGLMIPGLLLAALLWWVLPDYEPHASKNSLSIFDAAALNRYTAALTGVAALAGLAFLTFTSTVPLWLVDRHHVGVEAPVLGWTLASFALSAGLGAIAGGWLAPRLGYAWTAAISLSATAVAFVGVLLAPLGAPMLLAAAAAGFLSYVSQPLLILAAQTAAPGAPTAAAGLVVGGGSGLAGLLYLGSGVVQASFGFAAVIAATAGLLLPAAALAAWVLRRFSAAATGRAVARGSAVRPSHLDTRPSPDDVAPLSGADEARAATYSDWSENPVTCSSAAESTIRWPHGLVGGATNGSPGDHEPACW